MTGLRRPCCICGIRVGCGIDELDGDFANYCGTVTDSPCPSTMSISFTIPSYTLSCTNHVVETVTIPAQSVITTIGFSHPTLKVCSYDGSITYACDIDMTKCVGGSPEVNYVTRVIGLRFLPVVRWSTLDVAPWTYLITSPCGTTPLDASPPRCFGICLRVSETFYNSTASSSVTGIYHGMAYNNYEIADCTELVPCFNSIGGEADLSSHEPSGISTITDLLIS